MNCPYCMSIATRQQRKKTSLKCFWSAALSSRMRRFATGKHALHHSSQTNYRRNDEGKQGGPGTWMRHISPSKGNGAISIEPSIGMATWLTRCGAEKRNMDAAKKFFQQALDTVGHAPERVTTDGHDSYPRAIRETLGSEVIHRCNRYLNNRLEQDHRRIKQRYYPMRGFASIASASRFCRAFDEVRQFFRVRTTMKQKVSLVQQRDLFHQRLEALTAMMLVA